MKITNKQNLPKVFEKLANANIWPPKPNSFGATSLLSPPQEIVLKQRYFHELESDVSDMVNLFIGNAVHKMLEDHDDTEYVEMYLKHEIRDNVFVSGKIDLYDKNENTIIDYKTARVNKIIYEDFDSWKKQGLIYSWLMLKNNIVIDKIRFIAILKDWSKFSYNFSNKQDKPYPDSPIYIYEQKIYTQDLIEIEKFIKSRVNKILELQSKSDEEILNEPLEKEFAPIVKYAAYKNSSSRASKIFDEYQQALDYIAQGTADYIEKRVESNSNYEMVCQAMQHTKKIIERKI